jgi:two-component system cell cycle sensor histidine kinase/response regulator CckA
MSRSDEPSKASDTRGGALKPQSQEVRGDSASREASSRKKRLVPHVPRPTSPLSSEDFRTLIRLSTAKMACFDFETCPTSATTCEKFVEQIYTCPSSLAEASTSFASLGGYSSVDAALGKPLSNFFPRSLGFARLFEVWYQRGCGGNTFEIEVGTPDGASMVLQAVVYSRSRGNNISRLWCVLRDITTQARALTALANAELHYRSLVERPGLILFRIRPDETLDYLSPSFREMLGQREGERMGSPCVILSRLHPDDLPRYELTYLARRTSSISPIETEFRLLTAQGSYHTFFIRQSPRLSPLGHVEFFDLIAVDIQNHKSLEEEIERGTRVALVGQLAAGISHDFNNHLTAILGHVDSGLRFLGADHPALHNFQEAKKALGACAHMARQLLDLGKTSTSSTRDVCLNELVHDACSLVSNVIPPSISLVVQPSPSEIVISADRVQLQQAIINLLLNARDAMPSGGRISVAVAAITNPTGIVPVSPCAAQISVSDTGTGMSPDDSQRVFQPFFTTKQRSGGTGLGLTMVKSIVDAHQGWIDLSTREGEGTTFSLFFPVPAQGTTLTTAKRTVDTAPVPLTPQLVRRSVAIAEDDEMIRNMLRAALVSVGCTVNVFENGVLLLNHLQRDTSPCHLIIIDDSMPQARGVQLLEPVRSLNPEATLVLTSGDPAVGREPILQRLNVMFLAKPFPLTDLLSLVQR